MPTDAQRQAYADKHYGRKEKDIESKACAYAHSRGVWYKKFKSAQNRGLPDRIFMTPEGVVFFIEFKAPKKKVQKGTIQRLVIDEMRDDFNAKVFETNDLDEAKRIIDSMVTFGEA